MEAFDKVVLPQPNIEILKAKLKFLLENRIQGSYSQEECESCYSALEEYYNAKIEKRRIDFPNWRTYKPELIAILLEDMLTCGTYQTEGYLKNRDRFFLQKGKTDDLVEYKYSGVRHILTKVEEVILREYLLEAVGHKYGFQGFAIDIDNIIKKYDLFSRTSSRSTSYVDISKRIEGNLSIAQQIDAKGSLSDICGAQNTNLQQLFLTDASKKQKDFQKLLLFQFPEIIQERLNFFAFLNSEYAQSKKNYDARIKFGSQQQFINLLLKRDDLFFENFYFEIYDMMVSKKYQNNDLIKSISYSRMLEALTSDFTIMKDFLNPERTKVKEYIFSYPEFEMAFQKGEPHYSLFLKKHEEYTKIDQLIKQEAEFQLMKIFMAKEFGTISNDESSRLDTLSKATITKLSSQALQQAEYQIVDLVANPSTNNGNGNSRDVTYHHRSRMVYNYLKDPVVAKYLDDVLDDDIRFEGVFATNVGTKVPGRKFVHYYVFSPTQDDSMKTLEPIGQRNNRTIIMKTKTTFEDFCEQLSTSGKSLDDFVKSGEAIRVNHVGSDVGSVNCPNRIRLIMQTILSVGRTKDMAEFRSRLRNQQVSREEVSLAGLSDYIIERVRVSDLVEAKRYITAIYSATMGVDSISLPRLKKLVAEVEDLKEFTGTSSDNQRAESGEFGL